MNNWRIVFIDSGSEDSEIVYEYMVDSTYDILCEEGEEVLFNGLCYTITRALYDYSNKKIYLYMEEN